ncbi:MAG: ribonuclease HI family protein [bacterium]|nr:ribonuclease HI family protein [bacterium]MDZ4231221.1 ribonuclease HI family protein [Patescibacteria group bacterium]
MPKTKFTIYTDGGSRGNPGPAALGAVVGDKEYFESIGTATNNVAEYKAVVFALKKAKQLLGGAKAAKTEVEVRTDSQLLVNQLNGEFKIKDKNLQLLFIEVWNLKQDFKGVQFTHVTRDKNKEADRLVNKALDRLL